MCVCVCVPVCYAVKISAFKTEPDECYFCHELAHSFWWGGCESLQFTSVRSLINKILKTFCSRTCFSQECVSSDIYSKFFTNMTNIIFQHGVGQNKHKHSTNMKFQAEKYIGTKNTKNDRTHTSNSWNIKIQGRCPKYILKIDNIKHKLLSQARMYKDGGRSDFTKHIRIEQP